MEKKPGRSVSLLQLHAATQVFETDNNQAMMTKFQLHLVIFRHNNFLNKKSVKTGLDTVQWKFDIVDLSTKSGKSTKSSEITYF